MEREVAHQLQADITTSDGLSPEIQRAEDIESLPDQGDLLLVGLRNRSLIDEFEQTLPSRADPNRGVGLIGIGTRSDDTDAVLVVTGADQFGLRAAANHLTTSSSQRSTRITYDGQFNQTVSQVKDSDAFAATLEIKVVNRSEKYRRYARGDIQLSAAEQAKIIYLPVTVDATRQLSTDTLTRMRAHGVRIRQSSAIADETGVSYRATIPVDAAPWLLNQSVVRRIDSPPQAQHQGR